MSFILDALKKSEIERQRQTVPGLMDTRAAARRNRLPVWAVVLAVLLGVNLLALTFVLLRESVPAAPAPAPSQVSAEPAADASPPATKHFSPLDTAPVYAPEIPVAADENTASTPPSASRPSPTGTTSGAPAHSPRRPDPLLSDVDEHSDNQEILPSISEISLAGAQSLPDLHLDVHVYATKPAERFVYINMRKYHEGATLQEGPLLERIRRDGVILNYQGLRFILPRQP
jgi:general secretion pathway protein B